MRAQISALVITLLALAAARGQQPNIVLIISDDAGFADWGFMDDYTSAVNPGQTGSPVPTPNLDRLRARGVLFTDAYTAAVCSPSRAALVTGSYQQRIGYEYNINNLTDPNGPWEGLRSEHVTIFERMGALGYTTGAIGKWHIGGIPDIVSGNTIVQPGNRPGRQGVDEFYGIFRGSRNYNVGNHVGDLTRALREMHLDANGLEVTTELEAAHAGEYVTNTFGQGAVDFIDRHYDDEDPFFLYVSFTCPHSPIGPSPDRNAPGITSDYGSMVFTMDKEIGRIMDKVADPAGDGSVDLTAETLFIFINDNGGASGNGTRNTPLRNWKGSTYEGGVRVPMIFAGAGVTADPGSVYSEPVHSIDLAPTCHELGGGAPLAEIDGVNLLPFVNGLADGEPHEAIVIRSEEKFGIRMGDWKLVRNGRGTAPQLFDLSTTIDEANAGDVAAANPEIVAQMLRILTEHELGFDKPRFHSLSSDVDSINRNDRFVFSPPPPDGGTFTPDLPLVGAGLRNGGFEDPPVGGGAQADRHTYAEASGWTNIGSGSQGEILVRDNLNRTTPQNAVIPDSGVRLAALDTGHTIAAGEVFGFSYWWRDASNWNDANDRIGFTFFTTVNDTLAGAIASSRQYLSEPSGADSSYEFVEDTHTADVTEVGKRLFVSFRGVDGNGSGNGFARVDDISVARGTLGGGGGASTANWSDAGAWTDADTGLGDTLLDIDAFAGAVLEFPVTEDLSYTATNDMTRATGLEFMLNQIVLTGTIAGEVLHTGRITGNALLFTEALDGSSAKIENRAIGEAFSFDIDTPIVVRGLLQITGDGTSPLSIRGPISDLAPGQAGGLAKRGDSTVTLAGEHTYTGRTSLTGGIFHLDNAALNGTSLLLGFGRSTLSGSGSIASDVRLAGDLAIAIDGAISDRIDVGGQLDLTGCDLVITGTPTEPSYIIASYGSLSDRFFDVRGLPAGYEIDYSFEDNGSSNHIAIVATGTDPYTAWAEITSGLSGSEAAFNADPNSDGVPNGIAFFLGSPDASADARPLLPAVSRGGGTVVFEFQRADAAMSYRFAVRHSADLRAWTDAEDGIAGVTVEITDDGAGAGLDKVTATLPDALALDGSLFLDLALGQ